MPTIKQQHKVKSTIQKFLLLPLFPMLFLLEGCEKEYNFEEFKTEVFIELKKIRETKSSKIHKWLIENKEKLAQKSVRSNLTSLFDRMHKVNYSDFNRSEFLTINKEIEEFFVFQLGNFYDLLFINYDGQIFYSIKLEDDFQTNIFTGVYSNTLLAEEIKKCKNDVEYIDFEYYPPSKEAASFYIFPVIINEGKGWIAAQLSINTINNFLMDREGLGVTGEVYLVNDQQLLLTESRFINVDSVLSKKIDTEAAWNITGSSDSNVIKDYRNIMVLSSSNEFQFDESFWKLIIEKDEAEVITDYYRMNKHTLFPLLVRVIKEETEKKLRQKQLLIPGSNNVKVDVGELVRADSNKALLTSGVSTCTAIAAYAKNMNFVYMAHLTPLDLSYNPTKIEKISFGDKITDLTSVLVRKILYFEVKSCQKQDLTFVITATHEESLMGIIDTLIGQGIFLSQIKVGLFENTMSVDLYSSNSLSISIWDNSSGLMYLDFNKIDNLGEFIKNL